MKLSVVIAAYDEAGNVEPLTRRLAAALATIPDCSWELLFVVEGEDGTHEALQRLAKEIGGLRILYRQRPVGLGAAFRRGFAAVAADADYVITMDADLNHQPEEIPRLLAAARRLECDVLVGSRFVSGGTTSGIPLWKRLLSGVVNRLMSGLYSLRVRDKTSGFRIYRAEVLRSVPFDLDDFAFLPEILIRATARGYRIAEEPIYFLYRREGYSKMGFVSTSLSYLSLLRGVRGRSSGRRFALVLALLLLAAATLLYLPTFGASFAYDDMDHLNLVADALAAKAGFWPTLFRPHLEHLLPMLNAAFYASLALFGAKALPVRLLVFAAHVGAAWFMGLAARRYGGTSTAGFAAGLAYVLPAGFSSMWIWELNGSGVILFLLGLTGAVAAVAYRDRLGPLRTGLLAGAATLFAAASESTLAPLLLFPALLLQFDQSGRIDPFGQLDPRDDPDGGAWPRRRPALLTVFFLAVMIGIVGLAMVLYRRVYHGGVTLDIRHGIPRALFLLAVSPLRLVCPGLPLPYAGDRGYWAPLAGCLFGITFAAGAAALLVALWRDCPRRLLRVAALAAVGPVLEIGLVGIGRATSSYPDLYDADRYFFTLLLPICLLAGVVAEAVRRAIAPWPRRRRQFLAAVLGIGLLAEASLHRHAMLHRIPFEVFARHERRFAQLERLGDDLAAAAARLPPGSPPLALPDTNLWFPDVHNGRVSMRLFLYGIRRGIPGVRLGETTVSPRDERLLNPVLARWATEIGEPAPYLSISRGRLVNARMLSLVDFRVGAEDLAVVTGFYAWEGDSRWMGERAELRLQLTCRNPGFVLTAPLSLISRRLPGKPLELRVTAVDEDSGKSADLGSLRLSGDGVAVYSLDTAPLLHQVGAGRMTRLILTAEPVWQPRDVLPGTGDDRRLTVRFFAVGCGAQL
jgi:dolichol-phosphate mannosyltransferase